MESRVSDLLEFYPEIKWVHICAVIASGSFFTLRGAGVLAGALWPRRESIVETVTVPTAGAAVGEVTLKFSAGELEIMAGSVGNLLDGTFEGGVIRRDLGPGRVELETDIAPFASLRLSETCTELYPFGIGRTFFFFAIWPPSAPIALDRSGG